MGYVSTIAPRKASYWGSHTSPVELGYYTNDTSSPQVVNSITCYLGVGKANTSYTWGNYLTGTGNPISFYVQCAGVNSNRVTISNPIDALLGQGGYYPNVNQCVATTVTFNNLVVQPGSTVYFTLPWLVGYTNNVFIINYRTQSVSTSTATYTVTYNANGGSNAPAAQIKQNGVTLTLTTAKPTSPNVTLSLDANGGSVSSSSINYSKSFKHWNTVANGSGTSYASGAGFTANANTTLYAQYGAATVTNLPTPTRLGYTFNGWFTSNNTQIVNGSTISSNTTVTARWTAHTYTVSYNANGGSRAPAAQTKYHGTNLKLHTSAPTKSVTVTFNANGGSVNPASKVLNCPFVRWNTSANGSGTNYSAGATYTSNASATLYAQWSASAIGQLPTPTRANCTFVGWFSAINGGSQIYSTTSYGSNATIYARYDYTIQYDLNGGTTGSGYSGEGETTIASSIKKHRVNLVLTAIRPTKSGMTFLGWSENKSATSATYPPGGTFTKDAPTVLYAVYGVATYTVTFDLAGGTYTGGGALVQTVQHGKSATLPNNPTKEDSDFKGWIGNHTSITKNTTITAMWNHTPLWILKSDKKWHSYLKK